MGLISLTAPVRRGRKAIKMTRDQKSVNGVTYEWFYAEEIQDMKTLERGPCVTPSLSEESIAVILAAVKSGKKGVWISNPMKVYSDYPSKESYQAAGSGYYEYAPGTSNFLEE